MPDRRSPSADVPPSGEGTAASDTPARPVDPFRKQLESQPRELPKPGQSGFFRPDTREGRYSLRDVPAETLRPALGAAEHPPPTPTPPSRLRDTLPGDTGPGAPAAGSSPSLEVPPPIRQAAERWHSTGAIHVSPQASSLHARALQRAMLIALMVSPPGGPWPELLARRAQWLFRAGWHNSFGELDACLGLLDLPSDPGTVKHVLALIEAHLQELL